MILYKYTDLSTASLILKTKKFRYTQPIAFNDPFEVSPIAEKEISENFLNENINFLLNSPVHKEILFNKAFDEMFNKLSDDEKGLSTFDDYKEYLMKEINEELRRLGLSLNQVLLERLNKIRSPYTNYFFKMFPLTTGQSTGVFCLSNISNNILMWSHYANSHLGIVLEIETNNSFFSNLSNINYTTKRPSIDVNISYEKEDEKIKFAKNIFYTKSEDWSYENEFRDLKLLSEGENTNQVDGLGFPIVLFQFPTEVVKGIIFGSRIALTIKKKIIETSKLLEYKLDFKEAILDKKLFKINIENYDSERKIIE